MYNQPIPPPKIEAEHPSLTPAPVDHDRGFLVDAPFLPRNPCPLDERALALGIRVTLMIAPTGVDQSYSQRVDGHHGAAFPSNNPALGGDLLTVTKNREMIRDDFRAIRWSRV